MRFLSIEYHGPNMVGVMFCNKLSNGFRTVVPLDFTDLHSVLICLQAWIRFPNLLKLRLIPHIWNSVLHLFLEFHFAKCDDECKNLMIVGVNCCTLVTTLKMDTNSMTNDLRKPTLQKKFRFCKNHHQKTSPFPCHAYCC